MNRPSKWGEIRNTAHQSGVKAWGESFDRKVAERTLHPAPDAELVETESGMALAAPPAPQIREGAAVDDLLGRFARLAGQPESEYLAFARRYGLLKLCEHGLPSQHPPGYEAPCTAVQEEPLRWWRRWSERARAALAVATKVHNGETGRAGDWAQLPAGDRWPVGEELEADRYALGEEVDNWLTVTGARLRVLWEPDEERPTLEVGGFGLFQNLARELALTVAKMDGLTVCDGCGTPYNPERKPREDRNNYCPPCREAGVPARIRKRRQRQKGENNGSE